MHQRWADYRVFWREFRQQYHTTGALLPSGKALSRALARFVREPGFGEPAGNQVASAGGRNGENSEGGRRILEVGPGTGAVTGQIIAAMRPTDQLLLVERNEQFVDQLRHRLSDDPKFRDVADRVILIHASVEDLPEDQPYDLIISGLPLNNFAVETVDSILSKLLRLLAPGGTLSFFEYVAVRKAKSMISRKAERERLRGISQIFDRTLGQHEIGRDLVLMNVTPAWVHHVKFQAGSKEQGAGSKNSDSSLLAPRPSLP
jgi:phosphatidylethanolamine/phosphatidyl-N-methylethanolamine N-methyltransferase